jgi:hypothetical protein
MDDRRDAWLEIARRALRVAPVAAGGALLLSLPAGCPAAALLHLFGLLAIVAAAAAVAPGLAGVAAEPVGSLFYPRHFSAAQPAYGRAEAQRRQGRFEASLAEYEHVLDDFPADVTAYTAMLEIAALDLRDRARFDALAKRTMAAVADETSRMHIVRVHRALVARRQEPPESQTSRRGVYG